MGVPRSGMLAASILSLGLNCRLGELGGFVQGQWFRSDKTRGQTESAQARHALTIDDSIKSGVTMRRIREQLHANIKFTFCAVYGSGEPHPEVDFVEHVPGHRAFQRNFMHHPGRLGLACFDIHGILCADPEGHENDDGPAYHRFLAAPKPRFTPTGEFHTIVTSRLEKYRPETEAWVGSRGIRHRNFAMLDLPDAETRRRMGNHARFKASVYREFDTHLFVESEEWQAREIAMRAGKPVLGFDGQPTWCTSPLLIPRDPLECKAGSRDREAKSRLVGSAITFLAFLEGQRARNCTG